MNNIKRCFVAIMALVIIAVLIMIVDRVLEEDSFEAQKNPYEYDLSRFKATDPELVLYEEIRRTGISAEKLYGIAVDAEGGVYVSADATVVILNSDGNISGSINIGSPALCLAVGGDKKLYLGKTDHVDVYDRTGVKEAEWASLGEEALITSVAAAADAVFVADYRSRLIWHFNTEGKLLGQIGKEDSKSGNLGFILPSPAFDCVAAGDGSLWVVNSGRLRLEQYLRDGRRKSFWGTASMTPEGFSGCCNPVHVAIGPDGSFFTSEKGINRIKVYDNDYSFRGFVAGQELFDADTGGHDIAVGPNGRVFVLDSVKKTVRVFAGKVTQGLAEEE